MPVSILSQAQNYDHPVAMPITEVTKTENRQLQNIANILASSQKVVIVTGAGISTNCGIPVSFPVHLKVSADSRRISGLSKVSTLSSKPATTKPPPPSQPLTAIVLHPIHVTTIGSNPNPMRVLCRRMSKARIFSMRGSGKTQLVLQFSIGSSRHCVRKSGMKSNTPRQRTVSSEQYETATSLYAVIRKTSTVWSRG